MYERFYQLRERPFALSPDPEYLFPSSVHRLGLDYLRYGIEGHAGFVVITGEIGSGKTTLLQALLRNLDAETTVARLLNTILEPRELLEAIMLDLGVDTTGMSKPLLLRELARILVQQRSQERRVILVIDEAQNLSLPSLEEVRMLSNFETEKSKLIQIILVGQPELRDRLTLPELEQLRQRVTVTYHIQPLDATETQGYINHRLRRAALGPPLQFTRDVTDLVYVGSRGVPRMINVICDSTLLFGYANERRIIDSSLVRSVLDELETSGVLKRWPSDFLPAAGTATAVATQAPSNERSLLDQPSEAPGDEHLPIIAELMRPRTARVGERDSAAYHGADDRARVERTPNAAFKPVVNQTPEKSPIRWTPALAASPIIPPLADALALTHAATPVAAARLQAPAARLRSEPPTVWERFKRLMLDVPGTELEDRL